MKRRNFIGAILSTPILGTLASKIGIALPSTHFAEPERLPISPNIVDLRGKNIRSQWVIEQISKMSTRTGLIGTTADPLLARYASDYIWSLDPKSNPTFDFHDLIAVWVLRTREAHRYGSKYFSQFNLGYYDEFYMSLLSGLGAEDSLSRVSAPSWPS